MSGFNDNSFRKLIYGVENKVPLKNNTTSIEINFDNAATTPPFKAVIEDVIKFAPYYSSIHRGEGYKSRYSTSMYEKSRFIVKQFIDDYKDICDVIYVKNCTEAINKLAEIWAYDHKNSIILSTFMEHHSNDLPWRRNFDVKYIDIDKNGCLNINDLKNKFNIYGNKISLVVVSGASNVTGSKNSIHDIAKIVHSFGAKILVDGAQLVPHSSFSMGQDTCGGEIDFLAFSAHKMYAPFGCGVLIGPKDFFNSTNPGHVGGGTITYVTHNKVIWAPSPDKEEAGSPNVIGSVVLASSMKLLSKIGMNEIENYERTLTAYATENMTDMDSVILYGNYDDILNKVSIIPFNIEGMHHSVVAKALAFEFGIAVRSGCFCAHPYMQRLLKLPDELIEQMAYIDKDLQPGMIRISFGLYNTLGEVNSFLYALNVITKNKDYYTKKYGKSGQIF
ncbi:aminotransferase class V-fold PLP-dependent enzyme [Clostridium culturomicium]|uniref:aminotransferase class V-fold PLP-dependent enzyme n=1 Tax=Clostridium culturomicium TaxID=1499683 RepID=UPI00059102FC|nr:aminotransferase class V-fold PLP-dependent enzyme [Clostridium culturomicium]